MTLLKLGRKMRKTPSEIIKEIADYAELTRCDHNFQRVLVRCEGLDQLERTVNDASGSTSDVRDYALYLISKHNSGK